MIDVRPTLALTVRALREDTRLLRVHLVRLLFVGFILWLMWQAHVESRAFGAPGLRFFESVCLLDLVVITIAGFGYFTTAIAEEKEEQTVGLLTMADIGPTAMLIGKSMPRLIGAGLVLFAQFPFTLLAVTLGGVLRHQIVAAYLSMLAYLVFVAGLGVLFSVLCRTSAAASRNTVIVLAVLLLVPFIVRSSLSATSAKLVAMADDFLRGSPFLRIAEICQTGFSGSVFGFQVATNFAAGAALLGLARLLFPRFVRDEATGGATRSLFDSFGRRTRGSRGSAGLRPRRAWGLALAWKDFYFTAGGLRIMVVKLIGYFAAAVGVFAWMWKAWGSPWSHVDEVLGATLMVMMTLVFVLELAVLASRVFHQEIRGETLATIAMLPSSISASAFEKVAGCLLGVAPSLAYFCLGVLIFPKGFFEFLGDVLKEPSFWWFASQVVLFIHLTAFYSVCIRWGALPLAFGTIFLGNACCISAVAFGASGSGASGGIEAIFVLLTMITWGIIFGLYFVIGERLRRIVAK